MHCPACGKENAPGSRFCIFCGSPLAGIAGEGQPSAQVPGPQGGASLEEVREIRRALVQLSDRVSALERPEFVRGRPSPQPAPQSSPPEPPMPSAAAGPAASAPLEPEPAAAIAAPPISAATGGMEYGGGGVSLPSVRLPSIDWERVLGLNWLAIIGAVALAIGMGFFLKLSFDNDWIGETGRVILGIVSGVALLGIGEYAQRRYPVWAQAVTGGGIAILYLSIYAAFGFYKLIPAIPAFLFLALVVVVSGLAALRYESLVIALLGIFGAFLTPVLLGSDLPDRRLLLGYILLVDVGILGVSTFRNWRWFTLVGLIVSYVLFALWEDRIPATELVLAQVGLTGIFLIFVGATTIFHILWRRTPGPPDMALMTLNAMAYFGLTFGLLWPRFDVWFGFISLALSLFYGMVGYAAIHRSGAPPQVALFSLATALVFLTIAAPLQFTGRWITVAWAAEGAVLLWVGLLLRTWQARAFALGIFGIAAFRLLFFDTEVSLAGFRPVLNARFPTFVVAITAFYFGAYLYWRERTHLQEWEEYVSLAMVGAANLLTLWVLSAEAIAYFDSRTFQGVRWFTSQEAQNWKLLSLTALWSVYAMGLMAVAMARRSRWARWAGLALLSIPVLKLIFVDTFVVKLDPRTYILVLNFHFLTFVIVLAAVLFAAYLYWRQRHELLEKERYIYPALIIAANALSIWALSAEALRFFGAREVRLRTDLTSAQHLSLTVLWAVYAIGVIAAGIARRSSAMRLAGLALLAVPVAKLFVFDVFLLERGYRVAAFVTLGVLLLATGLVYQRYSREIRGFLFGKAS